MRTVRHGKLPESIKHILVVRSKNLDNLLLIENNFFEMNSSAEIYSACSNSSVINIIFKKIFMLENQILALKIQRPSRSEFWNSSSKRNKSGSQLRKRLNPNEKFCYYHFKFSNQCYTNKCKSPYSRKTSENSDHQ